MDRKDRLYKQAGFSLIEVLVAVGLLGIVTTMFMNMSYNMSKLQADVERRQDEQELRIEVSSLLNNKEYCTASLGRVVDSNNPDALNVQNLVYKVNGTSVVKFSPTQVYGKIRIDKMFLTATPGNTEAQLNLEYTRLNNTSIPPKKIGFSVVVDWDSDNPNRIESCTGLSNSLNYAEVCRVMGMGYTGGKCVPPSNPETQVSYTTLKTNNSDGHWGDWAGARSYCGGNAYVIGIQTRVESEQNRGVRTRNDDDTAMNAVRLICGNNHATFGIINVHTIKSLEGPWGDWAPTDSIEYCPWGSYAKGFQTQVERPQRRNTDDTAMNTVKLICSDNAQSTITSYQGFWGDWGSRAVCPTGKYICGFKTRVEKPIGGGDDTGLNGVEMYCCSK